MKLLDITLLLNQNCLVLEHSSMETNDCAFIRNSKVSVKNMQKSVYWETTCIRTMSYENVSSF